jgi:GT2 family glycosyltransferase
MNRLSIAICTRNRWAEVAITLRKLQDCGLDTCQLLLGDDASTEVCPIDLSLWPGGYDLYRSEQNVGYIEQRNRLIQSSRAPFVLVLDDDSSPISADFSEALGYLENENVALVGFPVRYSNGQWQVRPQMPNQQLRSFIGCAHIVKRDIFLRLGGYNAQLVHQGEEPDFAVRLFIASLKCVHCDKPEFEHRFSQSSRSYERMDYYGTRNELLFFDWYAPCNLWPYFMVRTICKRLLLFVRVRRASVLKGLVEWLRSRSALLVFRRRLTRAEWRAYQSLPW